jgi:hypothetical protein
LCLSLVLLNAFVLGSPPPQQDWETMRGIAEAEHEIIMLLIEQKKFDAVPAESAKIFSLEFPEAHRGLLVEGTQEIVDALIHHKQYSVGLAVVDQCIPSIRNAGLLSELHKLKAYLLRKLGRDEEAMEHFRRSVELAADKNEP